MPPLVSHLNDREQIIDRFKRHCIFRVGSRVAWQETLEQLSTADIGNLLSQATILKPAQVSISSLIQVARQVSDLSSLVSVEVVRPDGELVCRAVACGLVVETLASSAKCESGVVIRAVFRDGARG